MNHIAKALTDQQRIELINKLGSGNITNKIDSNRRLHATYNPGDWSGFTTSGSASISRMW